MSARRSIAKAVAVTAPAAIAAASCTPEQVSILAIADVFGGGSVNAPLAVEAVSVARCESGLNPNAYNPTGCGGHGCYGLFQHHGLYAPGRFAAVGHNFYTDWNDPYANAKAAKYLYTQAGGWGPWACRP